MRVTYKDLRTKSYKQLIKEGATEDQIRRRLSRIYLQHNKQLIINENEGLTLSRAVKELNKGRVPYKVKISGKVKTQSITIDETVLERAKKDVKNLTKTARILGKKSFANKLLTHFERGELNVYELNASILTYVQNPGKYDDVFNKGIEIIVDGYTG